MDPIHPPPKAAGKHGQKQPAPKALTVCFCPPPACASRPTLVRNKAAFGLLLVVSKRYDRRPSDSPAVVCPLVMVESRISHCQVTSQVSTRTQYPDPTSQSAHPASQPTRTSRKGKLLTELRTQYPQPTYIPSTRSSLFISTPSHILIQHSLSTMSLPLASNFSVPRSWDAR
ncbi:hypothetical protein BDV93DRAFT_365234 [Ceratobasidium sp. AG-I]|nr:hypothetical protein BDV93DRAFT_365234 [Ceratobasidium sp. AG-I]